MSVRLLTQSNEALVQEHARLVAERARLDVYGRALEAGHLFEWEPGASSPTARPKISGWLTTASTDALQQEYRRLARERAQLRSRNRMGDALRVGAQVVKIERELARRGEKPIIESIGPQPAAALAGPCRSDVKVGWKQLVFSTVSIEWLTTASTDALQEEYRRLASERAWLRSRNRMRDAMGVGAQVVKIERELARRGEKPIIESIGPQPAAALSGHRRSDVKVGWKQLLSATIAIAFGGGFLFLGLKVLFGSGAVDGEDIKGALYAFAIGWAAVCAGAETWGHRFGWVALPVSDERDDDGDDESDEGDDGDCGGFDFDFGGD